MHNIVNVILPYIVYILYPAFLQLNEITEYMTCLFFCFYGADCLELNIKTTIVEDCVR